MAKISKRLMGVCSAAVTAVYAVGYMYTMPSAQASVSVVPDLTMSHTSQSSQGAAAKAYQANTPTASGAPKKSVAHRSDAGSHIGSNESTSNKNNDSTATTSSKSTETAKTASVHAALYKDGVYTGVGTNPYGSLALTVSIVKGKIASVQINQYSMHYPQSVIDPQLPQEAVSMQTWKIYIVSGATASTYNFAEAMYAALKKAKL